MIEELIQLLIASGAMFLVFLIGFWMGSAITKRVTFQALGDLNRRMEAIERRQRPDIGGRLERLERLLAKPPSTVVRESAPVGTFELNPDRRTKEEKATETAIGDLLKDYNPEL